MVGQPLRLGGALDVVSHAGGGTTVRLVAP